MGARYHGTTSLATVLASRVHPRAMTVPLRTA